jgi:hypothetical protein
MHAGEPLVGNEDVGVSRTAEGGPLPFHFDATFPFSGLEEEFG